MKTHKKTDIYGKLSFTSLEELGFPIFHLCLEQEDENEKGKGLEQAKSLWEQFLINEISPPTQSPLLESMWTLQSLVSNIVEKIRSGRTPDEVIYSYYFFDSGEPASGNEIPVNCKTLTLKVGQMVFEEFQKTPEDLRENTMVKKIYYSLQEEEDQIYGPKNRYQEALFWMDWLLRDGLSSSYHFDSEIEHELERMRRGGFIEPHPNVRWNITDKGRKLLKESGRRHRRLCEMYENGVIRTKIEKLEDHFRSSHIVFDNLREGIAGRLKYDAGHLWFEAPVDPNNPNGWEIIDYRMYDLIDLENQMQLSDKSEP